MAHRVTAVEALALPCPPEQALPAVWDIQNIERCEVKADQVTVYPRGDREGSYHVRGRLPVSPGGGRSTTSCTRLASTAATPTCPAGTPPSRAGSS
jgi:hypothetical protein